jgi:GTPase Era involved in 16S rRNA processing
MSNACPEIKILVLVRAQEYRRMKLMLVGRQKQGKSTLLRALMQGCEGYVSPHFNARREGVHSAESGG